MFAVPFADVARIVDRTPAAARQLASRARRRVRARRPGRADRRSAQVVDAFPPRRAAATSRPCSPCCIPTWSCAPTTAAARCRSSRAPAPSPGDARFFAQRRVAHPATVDGAAGLVATEDGTPVAVLRFTVVEGRITAVDALDGPARVAGLGLEAFVAD